MKRRKKPVPYVDVGRLGTLVYDEVAIPIVAVVLAEGKMTFVGRCPGPVKVTCHSGEFRIHGNDGSLVMIMPTTIVESEEATEGTNLTVFQPVELEAKHPGRWAP